MWESLFWNDSACSITIELSLQEETQQKSKGRMLVFYGDLFGLGFLIVLFCFALFCFFLIYSKYGRKLISPWSSRAECLIEWLLLAEWALNLLSHVFLGGTCFLPEEVCKVRQISDLGSSCLSAALSDSFLQKNFVGKVCQKLWSVAKCFSNGKTL